jgi:hypothetical protein
MERAFKTSFNVCLIAIVSIFHFYNKCSDELQQKTLHSGKRQEGTFFIVKIKTGKG